MAGRAAGPSRAIWVAFCPMDSPVPAKNAAASPACSLPKVCVPQSRAAVCTPSPVALAKRFPAYAALL